MSQQRASGSIDFGSTAWPPGRAWSGSLDASGFARARARFVGRIADPPEQWERAVCAKDWVPFDKSWHAGHPFRPPSWEDLPDGSGDALDQACGLERLDQLFVIPACSRWIGGNICVWTPTQVLAFGTRAMALWVDVERGPKIPVEIPKDELWAVGNTRILLYSRLVFYGRTQQLRIRYNTVARPQLEPALASLRREIAGPYLAVPPQPKALDLPFKWSVIAGSEAVVLPSDKPPALLFGERSTGWRRPPCPVLVALSEQELIVATESIEESGGFACYGIDSLHVPRRRLERAEASGPLLRVRAAGSRLEVNIGAELASAVPKLIAAAARAGGDLF